MKQIEEKTALGVLGHALSEILIKLFAPLSESFTRYDVFCWHIFDLCVLTSGQE